LPGTEREKIEAANQAFVASTMTNVLARAPASGLADWQPAPLLRQQIQAELPRPGLTVGGAINAALRAALERGPHFLVLGEDLHDQYGGAFKITKGLSSSFPDRIVSTPISEAGITGTAVGLAMQGWRVVVEIMFADFLTLCADQLYNHATKFPYLFDTDVALVMRSPSGGGRGYGPTHSQSPESIMASIRGSAVVYPSHRHDCGAMLAGAINNCRSPVIFMEHKLLYQREQNAGDYRYSAGEGATALFPVAIRSAAKPDLTIITYGGALMLVEDAAKIMEQEEELAVEIIVPSLLTRAGLAEAVAMVSTSRVGVFEECPDQFSIGSQIVAELLKASNHSSVRHIGALPVPIPSARTLEQDVLPSCESLVTSVLDLVLNSPETEA
jgi:2-oxoisovalerate dehydrogenase E1 component